MVVSPCGEKCLIGQTAARHIGNYFSVLAGFVDQGESLENAVTLVNLLQQLAPEMGFEIVIAAAPKSADVLAASQSLVGKVDVIYVPTDNTIVSALEAVITNDDRARMLDIGRNTLNRKLRDD